ncbi:MAG: hypothetical protein JXR83_00935, partial [Deltaproteobacteria bacterium]|nr:hypothetical protein [Deltaproteobacteria bacterium]
ADENPELDALVDQALAGADENPELDALVDQALADADAQPVAAASAAPAQPVPAPAVAPPPERAAPPAPAPADTGSAHQMLPASVIPPPLRKHVDPKSPAPVRLMAARAMVPMAPRDQVHIVYQLTFDGEPKIAAMASKTMAELPERILDAVVGDNQVAGPVLHLLAENNCGKESVLETLLLNPSTPDSAFAYLAEHCAIENIIEMVANNQQRLLRSHDIVRKLKRNPHTLRSTLDRVVDFMVRSGVLLHDLPEFAESFSRLNQKEMEQAVAEIEVPFELLAPEEQARLHALGLAPKNAAVPALDEAEPEIDFDDLDMLAAAEALDQEVSDSLDNKKRRSVLELMRKLTVAQLVKLAMLGNKEVRNVLLRSTVRMVAEAAIKSPRISEMEVISACASRSVQDVVIRNIASNRNWTRLYQVKLALVNNPKTPMTYSISFLRSLRQHDLKSITRSKNLPSALVETAKNLLKTKQSGGAAGGGGAH